MLDVCLYMCAYIVMSIQRLVVNLDEEIHRRLKVHCAMEGITAADVVRKLIEDYLQKVEKKKSK